MLFFTRRSSNLYNMFIVERLRYCETKTIFDLDSDTFELHLIHKFYIVYIVDTFITTLSFWLLSSYFALRLFPRY